MWSYSDRNSENLGLVQSFNLDWLYSESNRSIIENDLRTVSNLRLLRIGLIVWIAPCATVPRSPYFLYFALSASVSSAYTPPRSSLLISLTECCAQAASFSFLAWALLHFDLIQKICRAIWWKDVFSELVLRIPIFFPVNSSWDLLPLV